MKLVILGGGGFRVPLIYDAVASNVLGEGSVSIDEIVLHDNSTARLDAIASVIDRHAADFVDPPRVG